DLLPGGPAFRPGSTPPGSGRAKSVRPPAPKAESVRPAAAPDALELGEAVRQAAAAPPDDARPTAALPARPAAEPPAPRADTRAEPAPALVAAPTATDAGEAFFPERAPTSDAASAAPESPASPSDEQQALADGGADPALPTTRTTDAGRA